MASQKDALIVKMVKEAHRLAILSIWQTTSPSQ
jgi:hypothetical protein